jgi:hypothetical protein
LFTAVLELCGKAGLVRSGVVTIDGTKLRGSASRDVNVDYGQIAREIIETAIQTDEAEEEHGDARGDELPAELSTDEGRRAWLGRELAAKREADRETDGEPEPESGHEFDAEQIVARVQGRDGWLLEGKRQLDHDRWQAPGPVPRSPGRGMRLWDAGGRLEEELEAKRRANTAYEHYRATAVDRLGRRLNRYSPKPYQPPETPDGTVNLTDPDARLMMGHKMFVQGYNAQAVVTEDQIVLAAEITTEPIDFSPLQPMIDATERELTQASITTTPEVAVADAGYWNERHMDELAIRGIATLIPPDSGKRKGERPGWTGGRYSWMRGLLASDLGGGLSKTQTVN